MLGPVRYRIVGLIFLLALINHIDRANISIAAPVMMRELGWSEALFGVIFSAFLWGYTVVQLPGGYIADRYGGKMIPYLCLGWSIATFLHRSVLRRFGSCWFYVFWLGPLRRLLFRR